MEMSKKRRMTLVYHQTLAVLPVYLVELMLGIGIGWIAPMLHQLKNSPETSFTSEQCAWIAALHYVSRGLSPFFAVSVIDRLGRNFVFVSVSLITFLMWTAVYCSKDVYVHYAVRLLFGLSVGAHETASSIYIGENVNKELRGIFSGVFAAFFYFGEVLEFALAAYMTYEGLAIVNSIFGFFTIVSMIMLKEPAQYLIMKGNLAKAELNYHWLHDLEDPTSKLEFEDIKQYVLEEKGQPATLQMYCSQVVLKSMRIIVITSFLCLLCGFTAVNAFVTIALSGIGGLSTGHLTILFGIFQFVTCCGSTFILDTFNRRVLFMVTSALMMVIHAATAALYFLADIYEVPYFNWILFVFLTIFSCLYGMFLFPLSSTIRGELLPQNVKAVGSGFSVLASSLGGFISARTFLPIAGAFGIEVNFILYSIVGLVTFLYIYFDLPETKGKTLTDIQRDLKGIDKRKTKF